VKYKNFKGVEGKIFAQLMSEAQERIGDCGLRNADWKGIEG
jgi:hypothetical protein